MHCAGLPKILRAISNFFLSGGDNMRNYQCRICNARPTDKGLRGVAIHEKGMRVFKFVCESCINNIKGRALRTVYPDSDSLLSVMHGSDTRSA